MKRTALVLLAGFALVAGASQARAQQAPADHLLISEVAYDAITESSQSSNSEYVEIFNPTAFPIDLSRVYLTDDPNRYVSITDPLNAPPNAQRPSVDSSDFMYRFPDGSQLRPGEIAVVTADSDVFFTDMGFIDAADFLAST
ncbi:MAG: lamin tail domain-containing protein, partial [Planctomycetota bacterium]